MTPVARDEGLDHLLTEEGFPVAAAARSPVLFILVVVGLRLGRHGAGTYQVRLVQDDNNRAGRTFDFQYLRSAVLRFLFLPQKKKRKKYLSHYSKSSIKKRKRKKKFCGFCFFLFRTALHEFHERGRAITRAKVYKASSSCNEKARKKKVIAKITREASFEIRVLARNI